MVRTHDCEPTLDDNQVVEFCKTGFLMLDGVVPDEINRRTLEFVNDNPSLQPIEILNQDWFDEHVIKNTQAVGAVRSLLGRDVGLPITIANHRSECPLPAQEWHFDGGSKYGPELDYLQVFYYPQDCPEEMGPTEVLPGSHYLFALRKYISHLGRIRGAYRTVAPAGSIFITVYSIWHRRSESTGAGVRNNLKYNYWRNVPPERDWIKDPDFDIATTDFALSDFMDLARPTFRQQFRDADDAAEMYTWLCGKSEHFRLMGGLGWPLPLQHRVDKPYGVPAGLTSD